MRRWLVVLSLVLFATTFYALDLGVIGGMEVSGRNRPFVGARLGLGDAGIGLSLEAIVPVTAFETASEELQSVRFVEVDPFLILAIPMGSSRLYAGIAPILVYDVDSGSMGLFSERVFHAKLGLSVGKTLRFSVEGMTAVAYTPESDPMIQSTGIFSVHFGISMVL